MLYPTSLRHSLGYVFFLKSVWYRKTLSTYVVIFNLRVELLKTKFNVEEKNQKDLITIFPDRVV